MATFRLYDNNVIYLYHWLTPKKPLKISTGLKIDPEKWDKEAKRPKSASYKFKGKNVTRELVKYENAFYEAINYFNDRGGFSPMKLKHKFFEILNGINLSTKKNDERFLSYYEAQVEEYKAMNINNWKGYQNTLNHLNLFFGREVPEFEDIDMPFYSHYNKYLKEKELSSNSISDHWKFIKAIMRKAQNIKLHTNSEYQRFKQFKEEADTVFLTEQELEKILELNLNGYLDKARDYFLIGCFTGLRYGDWEQLSLDKIQDGQAIIRSSKTGEKSVIPIANNVLRILGKYPDGKLPRKPSNQKLNEYIKKVAEKAEINDLIDTRITKGGKQIIETKPKYSLISTHTARRSYASIMVLNGVPSHLVMKVTGHKSQASFEKYIRFDELQASIQLKQSESFKKTFGAELTDIERMKVDKKYKADMDYLVALEILGRLPGSGSETE